MDLAGSSSMGGFGEGNEAVGGSREGAGLGNGEMEGLRHECYSAASADLGSLQLAMARKLCDCRAWVRRR